MQFEFLKRKGLTPAVHREIEAFLDRQSNSHPFQFPNWTGEQSGQEREDAYCAIVREQGNMRWFALCGVTLPLGKWLRAIRSLTVYRGPACDDANATLYGLGKLLEKSKELGFAYVEIAPDWVERPEWSVGSVLSRDGWQLLPEYRSTLRLDLRVGNDELLRSFRKATRYEIRRSEQHGIVIRFAQDGGDLSEFQRIYFAMAKKKDFLAVEPSHLAHVLRWIVNEKDRGVLLLAFKEEMLLGGTLVVRAATRSWYVFGATTKDHRLSAGHLLQWHAIRWAKEHGCTDYDFGGYREGVNTGPALFKRGFCQAVVQFSPVYRYPLNRRLSSILDFVTRARSSMVRAEVRLRGLRETEAPVG
jgi:peptidoglycan pentaglycine glycine transferase (the first glycine)